MLLLGIVSYLFGVVFSVPDQRRCSAIVPALCDALLVDKISRACVGLDRITRCFSARPDSTDRIVLMAVASYPCIAKLLAATVLRVPAKQRTMTLEAQPSYYAVLNSCARE